VRRKANKNGCWLGSQTQLGLLLISREKFTIRGRLHVQTGGCSFDLGSPHIIDMITGTAKAVQMKQKERICGTDGS